MAEKEKPETTPVKAPGQDKIDAMKTETAKVNKDMRAENATQKARETTPVKGWSLPNFLDLSDIQNIYGCLRDGDYFDAMRRSILLLNKFLNPDEQGLKLRAGPSRVMSVSDQADFDRACSQLETSIEHLRNTTSEDDVVSPQPRVSVSANTVPPDTQFGMVEILGILQIVMDLIGRFRKK